MTVRLLDADAGRADRTLEASPIVERPADGRFQVEGLPAGRYLFEVRSEAAEGEDEPGPTPILGRAIVTVPGRMGSWIFP